MSKKNLDRARSNRKSRVKSYLFIFIILALAVTGYYYWKKHHHTRPIQPTVASPAFMSLENNDKTLQAIVSPLTNIDILSVSKKFYGQPEYWPYIFKANIADIQNPLNIPSGTVLRIPKIDVIRTDKDGLEKAKALGDSILKNIDKPKVLEYNIK